MRGGAVEVYAGEGVNLWERTSRFDEKGCVSDAPYIFAIECLGLHLFCGGEDLFGEGVERGELIDIRHVEDGVGKAHGGEGLEAGEDVCDAVLAAEVDGAKGGLLNAGVIAAEGVTVGFEGVEGLLHLVQAGAFEHVAGIGVLSNEAKGLVWPHAADHDARVRLGERVRVVGDGGGGEMLAGEGGFIARPEGFGELQVFFQQLKALGGGGIGDAKAPGLFLIPGSADAQVGASAGKDIQGVDHFKQDGGVAVDDAGDQDAEAGFLRQRGEVAEGGVALQHGVGVRFAEEAFDLIVVVHDPQAAEADCISGGDDVFECRSNGGCAAGVFEGRDL